VTTSKSRIYGMMAKFDDADAIVRAAQRAYDEGYRRMDAFTPFHIHGLAQAIGFHRSAVPLLVLIGGIVGALGGFFLQWYSATVDYALNIAGRPYNSWPMFIPITFELTVLGAALVAVLGTLALNGLPMPYHPVFNAPEFELATRSHFFLCIEVTDQKFDLEATRRFLESLGAQKVSLVPRWNR